MINIASVTQSHVAFHQVAAYGASKAGVLALTRSLGCEWAKDHVAVNALMPGIFPTNLNKQLLTGTERGRELLLRTPAGRFGRPDELVGAAVFLASDGRQLHHRPDDLRRRRAAGVGRQQLKRGTTGTRRHGEAEAVETQTETQQHRVGVDWDRSLIPFSVLLLSADPCLRGSPLLPAARPTDNSYQTCRRSRLR